MTTIDWTKVGSDAKAAFDQQVQTAAGTIVVALDDLMDDTTVSRQVKLLIMERLGSVLGNRDQLNQLIDGKSNFKSLESGGDDTDSELQEKVDELEDKLGRANAVNNGLARDRRILEGVIRNLGTGTKIPVPADSSTPFDLDTPQRVREAIEKDVADARATASPVDVATLKERLGGVREAADKLTSHVGSTKIKGLGDLDEAVDEAEKALP